MTNHMERMQQPPLPAVGEQQRDTHQKQKSLTHSFTQPHIRRKASILFVG